MQQAAQIDFKFPMVVKRRPKWYLATCPALDLSSQGPTGEKALANLNEAVQAFVADCFERGTLDHVLRNAGFSPAKSGLRARRRQPTKRAKLLTVPLYLLPRGKHSSKKA